VYYKVLSGDDVWMVELDLSGDVGVGTRRRRSVLERRRVVEETLVPGASVAKVSLKHGFNANQVFQWRRLYRDGKLGAAPADAMKRTDNNWRVTLARQGSYHPLKRPMPL